MKKLLIAATMLAAMGFSATGWAADCANPDASAQIDSCAKQSKEAAEQALNKAWGEAKARIAKAYSADEQLQKAYQQNLLDSQRGWLKYRDNQCKMQAFLAEEGSAAHDTLTSNCISEINQQRVKQLNEVPYQ